jgi:glucokinase
MWQGGGKGFSNIVMVTLGTGVGGGIILGGKMLSGVNGAGGEIGHIQVNDDETEVCGCGRKGCLEQYTSATGIVRMANTLLNTTDRPSALRNVQYVSAKEVFDAAKQGDELAAEIVDRHGKCLGKALAQIACVVDPEVFVIGGGVSKAGTIITDTTEKYFKEYAFHACKNTKFTLATLGNDAGMYGGACAIMND